MPSSPPRYSKFEICHRIPRRYHQFVHSIPFNYFELEHCLGMFGNLLSTLLGTTHPLMVTYGSFWDLLLQAKNMELQHMVDVKRTILPVHLLRSVQIKVSLGFQPNVLALRPTLLHPTFLIFSTAPPVSSIFHHLPFRISFRT